MRYGAKWLKLSFLLGACVSSHGAASDLIVDDMPERNLIRITNRSSAEVEVYYNHISSFGNLQMFLMRFRDRNGELIPISDAPGGWFTPLMRYASLNQPRRQRLRIPAQGSVDFNRDLQAAVSWASWDRPVDGPCEVQIKLRVYSNPSASRPNESLSEWHPAPCPAL